ncbi:MAG: hypothetical protein A2V66_13500 [Ignavibacteria bacterium RBG_13_36_8]|nr:MAG: hypothetical protein A2V66_13500 [Ignavibacteria bacterium RBG_13_36_8]
MFKHLEGARLGIFIFIGTILLIISIFLIGNKESLFIETISIKTYFPGVEGLKNGAPVRLSGYDIGSVSNIGLAADPSGLVEVQMRINDDVKHFIRLDSEASIETEGLVGKKIVSITAGSPDQEAIIDGGIIKAKQPFSITEIIGETQAVMAYMKDITRDFSGIVEKINKGEGTIGKLLTDDRLYNATVSVTQSADKSLNEITGRIGEVSDIVIQISSGFASIVSNIDSAVTDVKNLVDKINKGEGTIGSLVADRSTLDSVKAVINNLVRTTEETKLGASRFAENMEALKYNWLFKGYFEQRGYWDKAEYEKEIDQKLLQIKIQNELLDQKIKDMLELEEKINNIQRE